MGIDPGTQVVGYGLVVAAPDRPRLLAAGVVRAPARRPVPERLGRIREEVDGLLDRFQPTVVVVEDAFAARNVRSALRIGEGRGVVLACAATRGLVVDQYPPAVVKKSLVGNGGASKEQVQHMVRRLLGISQDLQADEADGLAIAICHAQYHASSQSTGLAPELFKRRRSHRR